MVDLADKRSDSQSMSSDKYSNGASSEEIQMNDQQNKKLCADCGTSKTPLWRSGPAGPKSLCNACGIRSRKKRRAISTSTDDKKNKKSSNRNKLKDSLKERLLALGREVLMQKSTERRIKKLGEEEQAAVLLMAISYGSVYA